MSHVSSVHLQSGSKPFAATYLSVSLYSKGQVGLNIGNAVHVESTEITNSMALPFINLPVVISLAVANITNYQSQNTHKQICRITLSMLYSVHFHVLDTILEQYFIIKFS
jgi:hypothetical protein